MKRCIECEYLEREDLGRGVVCVCGHPDQLWLARFVIMRGYKGEPGVIKTDKNGNPALKNAPQFCPFKFDDRRERLKRSAD